MKKTLLTYIDEQGSYQSVIGLFDNMRTNLKDNSKLHHYQIRSDDDGKEDPVSIENKVWANYYGDFVTDTKIPFVENDYTVLSDYEDPVNVDYRSIDYNVEDMNDEEIEEVLENSRKEQMFNFFETLLSEEDRCNNPCFNNFKVNRDDSIITFNAFGKGYTLEIHNDKDYE